MDNTSMAMLLSFVVALIGIITPIMKLNSTITQLNSNFDNMMENDKIRDKRIEENEKEIDRVIDKQRTTEKILDLHELRIVNLEKKAN